MGKTSLTGILFDKETGLALGALSTIVADLAISVDETAAEAGTGAGRDVVAGLAGPAFVESVGAGLAVRHPHAAGIAYAVFGGHVGLARRTGISVGALYATLDDLAADATVVLEEVELVDAALALVASRAGHAAGHGGPATDASVVFEERFAFGAFCAFVDA